MPFHPSKIRRRSFELLEPKRLLAGDVVINEFMASNGGSVRDFEGDSSDWIELRNLAGESRDIGGWYLSDDVENLKKWKLPSVTLQAGDHFVVFASGKDLVSDSELHANFKLSSGGEFLSLTEPDGQTISSSYTPAFPPQEADVSFGFANDEHQNTATYLQEPTPGAANTAARISQRVIASHTSPTFVDPFSLTLSGAEEGQSIVYTLDGSMPTLSSPTYSEPIAVDQRLQVRARVVEDGVMGQVESWGYSQLTAAVAEFASELPIMIIDNYGRGAIPNKGFPNQTGADTFQLPRQAATVTLFEPNADGTSSPDANAVLHERIGIRVRGAYSSTFDEPGYSMEFWDESDEDTDIAPLDLTPHSDWVLYAPNPSTDRTLIDNTFLFSISEQMGHWAPSFRYVETFINTGTRVSMNDHVGLYVIEDKVTRGEGRIDFEKLNEDGTQGGWLLTVNRMDAVSADDQNAEPQNFHTPGPNGVLQTRPNSGGRADDIPRQYNAFINFEDPNGYRINTEQRDSIETWFANMEDVLYGRTAAEWDDPVDGYARYIDVDSFIDYFILNNISNNGDGFLLSMWLYNPEPNNGGKLTMGPIWDADLGSFQGDPANRIRRSVDRLWYTQMFEDPEFEQQLIDRWYSLRDTTLSNDNVFAVIDDLQQRITPEAVVRDDVTNWDDRLGDMKSWLEERLRRMDGQYARRPTLETIPSGFRVFGQGEMYYTLDGTDPRQRGGEPSAAAMLLEGDDLLLPNDFDGTLTIRANRRGNWSAPLTANYLDGDLNGDGQLNANDIDSLLLSIRDGVDDPAFDLNSDDEVNELDVTYLVESVFKTRTGDTNLDGRVDFADFLTLSANFGKEASWSEGNFDANQTTDFADFLALSAAFGFESNL